MKSLLKINYKLTEVKELKKISCGVLFREVTTNCCKSGFLKYSQRLRKRTVCFYQVGLCNQLLELFGDENAGLSLSSGLDAGVTSEQYQQ